MRTLHVKVAGVTYEGRQAYLAKLNGKEPVRLIPEPDNPYDPNAIAVHVAADGQIYHCGYIPRELAKDIAPLLEGESIDCNIEAITGGFELWNGDTAAYGLRLQVQLPDYPVGNITL
jgi:hypothetical protein